MTQNLTRKPRPALRWALTLAGFFAGVLLTFIVFIKFQPNADFASYKKVQITREFVAEMISDPGEEIKPFLLRVAPLLADFTEREGFEVCGVIAKNPQEDRLGVRLYTSRGRMTCAITRAEVPAGMFALLPTIHSHPQRRIVLPTDTDLHFYEDLPKPPGPVVMRRPTMLGTGTFSTADYAAGMGYVVTHGGLYLQNGKGTDTLIGAVSANQVATAK